MAEKGKCTNHQHHINKNILCTDTLSNKNNKLHYFNQCNTKTVNPARHNTSTHDTILTDNREEVVNN